MVKIISTTDFSIGLYLSIFGHIAILVLVVFGNTSFSNYRFTNPTVTDVKFISVNNFHSKNSNNIRLVGETKSKQSSLDRVIKDEPREYKELTIDGSNKNSVERENKFFEDSSILDIEKGKKERHFTSLEKSQLETVNIIERDPLALIEEVKPDLSTSTSPLYKRFDISDSFLLQEVFKNDPINNDFEDNQVIKELQVIIEPAVERCFNVNAVSLNTSETSVLVGFSILLDGKPDRNSIELILFEGGSQDDAEKLFDTAKRAILRCGISGYDLPRDKYDYWKRVEAKFNSKGMQLK